LIKTIKDTSEAIELEVLPQPKAFPAKQTWLPAKQILLTEQWQDLQTIRVGDSIARQITINAEGLMASQLPDLSFEDGNGYHIYPGQTDNQNQKTDEGVMSQKTLELAIVPTQAGKLSFPRIEVAWWNTTTQTLEKAILPERTLTVLPSLQNQEMPKVGGAELVTQAPTTSEQPVWMMISAVIALLWLLSLLELGVWIRRLQQQLAVNHAKPTSTESTTQVNQASFLNEIEDPKAFYQALLQWQGQNKAVFSTEAQSAINSLKAHLFNQQPLAPQVLPNIRQAVLEINTQQIKKAPNGQNTPLEPLYKSR
jgi:hypothetical protein